MKSTTARHLAFEMLFAVIVNQESLANVTPRYLHRLTDGRDRAFAYRLTLETLRQLNRFIWFRDQLLERPFKHKDQDVAVLLLLGICQLCDSELPAHASLHETVEVARCFRKKPWAVGLVNAVLRHFQRQQTTLIAQAQQQTSLYYAHPQWLITRLQQAYPQHWQSICTANNQAAALCLRLKPHLERTHYIAQLDPALNAQPHPQLPQAIVLNSTEVTHLPGYTQGDFSVQDAHAQWAAHLLAPQTNAYILDACAAPGGKTTHLLELNTTIRLLALDIDAHRLARIQENLQRLGLHAQLQAADAAKPELWWSGEAFDAILLDAPCSATGIIRRHPDIKWHRKPNDITQLVHTQQQLLQQLWSLLKPSGRLLYATCSVLPEENSQQIQQFISNNADAKLIHTPLAQAIDTHYGQQLLPAHPQAGDGFFYALLYKIAP